MKPDVPLSCSFCGKTQHHCAKLIAGPQVFICDECVTLCNQILDEEAVHPTTTAVPRSATDVPADELVTRLTNAASYTAHVDRRIKDTVDELRTRGYTWAQIGEALGTSRQAAWERFSSDD